MDFIVSLFVSPLFWLIAFLSKVLFQFFLAQKLRHKHAWFAFLPILSGIQWFQIGNRSGWNICWVFLPVAGLFVYIYKWFMATIKICERSGERGSFCILFTMPFVNVIATIRLAFKTGFWVKTGGEEKLISQVIKGLKSGHSVEELQAFATSHGIKLEDFETAVDKAQTIKNNSLKLSSSQYSIPVYVNVGAAVLWMVGSFIISSYIITVGIMSFFGSLVDLAPAADENIDTQVLDARIEAAQEIDTEYIFLMAVEGTEKEENSNGRQRLNGQIISGRLGDAEKLYLLDEGFNLIDLVNREGHGFAGNNGYIGITERIDTDDIAYVAMTEKLAALNAVWSRGSSFDIPNEPVILVDTLNVIDTNTNSVELEGLVKFGALEMDDEWYIYNAAMEVINAAKIKDLAVLNDETINEIDVIPAGTNVRLSLEVARESVDGAKFMTPFKDLTELEEYFDLLIR